MSTPKPGWIARDNDGELFWYSEEPIWVDEYGEWYSWDYEGCDYDWLDRSLYPDLKPGECMQMGRELTFDDALRIALGCFDYSGGYRADDGKLEIFHHGIQTVVNALTAAQRRGVSDPQTRVLHEARAALNHAQEAR